MPRLDKTGPRGEGPMTGRRLGDCYDDEKTIEKEVDKDESSKAIFGRRFLGRFRRLQRRNNGR